MLTILPRIKSVLRGLKTLNGGYAHFDSFPALFLGLTVWLCPVALCAALWRLCMGFYGLAYLIPSTMEKPSTGHYSGLQRAKGKAAI